MRKIIVTGFKPFGSYKFNPTAELARYYNGKNITGDETIIGIVLPCTYYGAFHMLSKIIDKERPDIIISTGLWSEVKGIRIETTFHNLMESKYPDTNGYNPDGIRIDVRKKAKKEVVSFADHVSLAKVLESLNIPIKISKDANAFICNSLGYLTTQKISDEKLKIKNIFIHIPWTDDYKSKIILEPGKIFLEKEKLYSAIELLIKNI